jgi:hypothetical protein
VNLRIEGARQVLASFRDLPKEATVAIRDAAGKIAAGLVRTSSRRRAGTGRRSRV